MSATPAPVAVRLHMTVTRPVRWPNEWTAACRCGWVSDVVPEQATARAEGDRHLAAENGAPQ